MFKLFALVIVVSYTLVLWHQENVQIAQKAFERTQLFQIVSNLRPGQYIGGDTAYILTDQVLFPFVGSQRESTNKDKYNHFLSQLCIIAIEMTFGLLTNKWRILEHPCTSWNIFVLQDEEISCNFFCLCPLPKTFAYSWMMIKRRNLLMEWNF